MYLHLYHGRKDPDEQMDDWGKDGGQFKIECLISTYCSHVRVKTEETNKPVDLQFGGDCLFYDGVYYGDWAIYDKAIEDIEIKKLDPNKAIIKRK